MTKSCKITNNNSNRIQILITTKIQAITHLGQGTIPNPNTTIATMRTTASLVAEVLVEEMITEARKNSKNTKKEEIEVIIGMTDTATRITTEEGIIMIKITIIKDTQETTRKIKPHLIMEIMWDTRIISIAATIISIHTIMMGGHIRTTMDIKGRMRGDIVTHMIM